MTKINTKQFQQYGKYTKRQQMVDDQLRYYGIRDKWVLDAFLTIPRHLFVRAEQQEKAYHDGPLSIGYSQTISQPYVVALMLEQLKLKPWHRVLEIGSGSGYVLALLSLLTDWVTGVELEKGLVAQSISTLVELQLKNVSVFNTDGYKGWPKRAPFDRILLSAAPKEFPENLFKQLKPDGRLVAPVGDMVQQLVVYEKKDGQWRSEIVTEVQFVPLRHQQIKKAEE